MTIIETTLRGKDDFRPGFVVARRRDVSGAVVGILEEFRNSDDFGFGFVVPKSENVKDAKR